ncbi:MAG: hypothetical protein LBH07_06425 [Treponema sp.]|jgi:hypothetical protein|nr:hypothetical protein [Treponema sp.]
MKKTLDDYMKDPDLAREPQALREVHAIRLKLKDERKGMSPAEYNAAVHQRALRFLGSDISPQTSGATQ